MSTGNRWDVMSIREYTQNGETKSAWTKVGAAFTNKNGSINVQLDCIPLDGKLQLQVPLTKEEREAKFGGHGQAMRDQTGQQRGGGQQQQRQQAPQGQGGQGGYQARGQAPQGNAARYGGRGQSQPQQAFHPPAYQPPPQAPQYQPDAGYEESPPPAEGGGWEIDGQWITDARQLPSDHPDFIPF